MPAFNPARSAFSRVFLIEGRARPDHEPQFQSCMKAGTAERSYGDIERIECPDSSRYGEFEEIGYIQGAVDRATSSLIGRYAADLASELLRLASMRCAVDVQVHYGACTDPRLFNTFTKSIVMENVVLTNWSVDDLGALSSDENSVVNETTDLSIGELYEVLPLSFAPQADDLMTNEAVDVVICDQQSCGSDCEDESNGCENIYVLVGATAGSPGTAPDIVYTLDQGVVWATDEVSSLLSSEDATALACLGDYMVVTSNDSGSLEWKLLSDLNAGTAHLWTSVTTGIVAGGEPNDIWSVGTYAFVVGDGGYVYGTSDPTSGVTVLDAAIATTNDLAAVHALDDQFAVAVGATDTIVYTENRTSWQAATATGGGNGLTAVWIKTEDEWFVTDDAGNVWYTLDQGQSWTESPASGDVPGGATALHDIQFATQSIGYVAGNLSDVARIWRTFDGGNSWVILPEGVGSMPTARDFNAIAACQEDANFVVGVGEGAVADDGIIVFGED